LNSDTAVFAIDATQNLVILREKLSSDVSIGSFPDIVIVTVTVVVVVLVVIAMIAWLLGVIVF
jgi:hypothetical protein